MGVICLLLILIFHNVFLTIILGIIAAFSCFIFLEPFIKPIVYYLRFKSWDKNTLEIYKSQDPTLSPAYVGASGIGKNTGMSAAYNHVLGELKELKKEGRSDKEIIFVLEERIKGAIETLRYR
jgi:hypothetical protein